MLLSDTTAPALAGYVADIVGRYCFLELNPKHVLGFRVRYRGQRLSTTRPVWVTSEPTESRGILGECLAVTCTLNEKKIPSRSGPATVTVLYMMGK